MSWYVVCLLYLLLDPFLVGGFINPSEKYESQLEWLFPIYGQIKFHGSKPPIRFDSHLQWTSAILMTTWRILKDQKNQKLLNTRTNPPWSMWFLGTWSHWSRAWKKTVLYWLKRNTSNHKFMYTWICDWIKKTNSTNQHLIARFRVSGLAFWKTYRTNGSILMFSVVFPQILRMWFCPKMEYNVGKTKS